MERKWKGFVRKVSRMDKKIKICRGRSQRKLSKIQYKDLKLRIVQSKMRIRSR
jgi:hypothetical protein